MMQKVRNAQATWPRRCGPIEGEERIPSGCAIAGMFHKKGGKIGGETIIRAMEPMHDRSNGLGGGFAGTGFILNMPSATLSTCSMTMRTAGKHASST